MIIDYKTMAMIAGALLVYLLVRKFFISGMSDNTYQKEVQEILNNEEHKVKGRHE